MRVIVAGLVASYPLGGVAWDYLAYVDGLRRLGCDVVYLEDTGGWFYDPGSGSFRADPLVGLRYLQNALRRLDADSVPWAVRAADGQLYGMSEAALHAACAGSGLLLNVSGACWLRDAYRAASRTAYLDTDPGFTQSTLAAVDGAEASEAQRFAAALVRAHDRFFTFAEHIGSADCLVPGCGLAWRPTRQPVVLDRWPVPGPVCGRYTTVLSWRTQPAAPRLDGIEYGGKDRELTRFIDLPARGDVGLELAISGAAPREALAARGWHVVEAAPRTATMDDYQAYLAASRGEWSVAKQAYVGLRSGWFSTRSAAYLASGRPVILQDTGWSAHYPSGTGLIGFETLDEAAAALAAVEADHAAHCEAARAIAEREFDAARVLTRLLDEAT